MRNFFPLLFAGIIFFVGCKKSDSGTEPKQDATHCRLASIDLFENGNQTYKVIYNYDSYGNISAYYSIENTGDTIPGEEYKFENGILKYSLKKIPSHYLDTTFYNFDANGKLINIRSREYYESTLNAYSTKQYVYNANGKVIYTVLRDTLTYGSNYYSYDSTLYEYTGNNVTKVTEYSNPGVSFQTLYYYDNQKNYLKTTHLPAISCQYWSENNIIKIDFGNYSISYSDITYNSAGFPLSFTHTDTINHQPCIEKVELNYKCN
ncbi:MAG: hypothetical protein Q8867_04460 [Bacteroidota bacterium]|nr:hypothetical protein [Bacteroidota bacterium]